MQNTKLVTGYERSESLSHLHSENFPPGASSPQIVGPQDISNAENSSMTEMGSIISVEEFNTHDARLRAEQTMASSEHSADSDADDLRADLEGLTMRMVSRPRRSQALFHPRRVTSYRSLDGLNDFRMPIYDSGTVYR